MRSSDTVLRSAYASRSLSRSAVSVQCAWAGGGSVQAVATTNVSCSGVGGIVAEATRATASGVGSIADSSSTASIVVSRLTGASSSAFAGGVAGSISYWTVANSFSDAAISFTEGNNSSSHKVGGFVGDAYTTTFTNAYSTGSITTDTHGKVGGFVGEAGRVTFNTTYAAVSMTASSSYRIGGFAGSLYSSPNQATSSFWDTSLGFNAAVGYGTLANVVGLTPADLGVASTFSGATTPWDIVGDVGLPAGNYPRLLS